MSAFLCQKNKRTLPPADGKLKKLVAMPIRAREFTWSGRTVSRAVGHKA
jgi:hypothetical protein